MSNNNKKTGSVMVVGGGIGGMQASLDLAEAGYKVYLLEKTSCIGGTMAQLDKTFPTNDCAMCTLAPRIVDAGSHLNIDKITNADLEKVEGEPGNFKVTINKRARYIDLSKCTGCSDCVDKCPVKVDSEFDVDLIKRNAIYRRYPQAVPGAFAIDKQGVSPCRFACPAGVNAHAYVALIAQRKYAEALEVVRRALPFAAICGRLCHHPCETECNRAEVDEPVSIRYLKRFIADKVRQGGEKPPVPVPIDKKEKIAVVGSGPSGLTCAQRLREKGYAVTVFEASDKPGGMLTSCIPDYRVPREIADYEIDRIINSGVEIKTNTRIGKDLTLPQLRQDYNAVFVAVGCQDPAKIPLEGSENEGVLYGVPFLRKAKSYDSLRSPRLCGEKVVVIGGGNVAIDCAKVALRLGARDVSLTCLETRDLEHPDRMPAHEWEIEEAEEEGIKLNCSLGPKKVIVTGGKVTGLETIKCESVYDFSSGTKKFAPKFSCNLGPVIEADTIIIATGQRADTTGFDELEKTPFKSLKADPVTMETNIPGVFAGGDIRRGPASVIEAVADGNEAAISIERYLKGEDIRAGRGEKKEGVPLPERKIEKKQRVSIPKEPAEERKKSFIEVEQLLDEEKAVAEASRCLSCAICCECLLCVAACEAKAINHDMPAEEKQTLDVGALILAPGFELFDSTLKQEFGFGRYPNVISSLQFERILSASGPYQGQILRPSDAEHPYKVAFIQCVGSREVEHNYCSSVCCMYATKEAIVAKEHQHELECHIFYIDIRAFGKGFEAYYERAKELGVKYTRCRPSAVKEIPQTKNLEMVYYDEDNKQQVEEFDMVVLSAGMTPPEGVKQLARICNVELNKNNFCKTGKFTPVETSRPGIYACGPFVEPKDIPETVMEASGAASKAMALLTEGRGTLVTKREYPPEKDVTAQEPRIGVFVCHCGKNIGGVADVPSIRYYAKTLPNVVYTEDNLYTCSSDTQKKIKEMIKEHNLNRVVVASCTPRTHESLFRNTCREAGLNPYLFEMANIRDQNTWVHMFEPEKATKKAKDLVRIAVAKSRLLEPLQNRLLEIEHDALVIGGGLSGMTAALELANQGFTTHLVERTEELGGNMKHLKYLLEEGYDPQNELHLLIDKVRHHPKIKLYTSTEVKLVEGSMGNFKTTLNTPNGEVAVKHGVVIVATGAEEYKPKEYRFGEDSMVITQVKFEEKLARQFASGRHSEPQAKNLETLRGVYTERSECAQGDKQKEMAAVSNPDLTKVNSAVMIQCVGSRDKEHPYCSRICCSIAIKNALKFKQFKPEASVYILYRDIRAYGFREEYYRKAREAGVVFIRYEDTKKPEVVRNNGKLRVSLEDPILKQKVAIDTDLVVLSAGIVPIPANEDLAKKLKVPLNQDKFFLEAHMKLRPVDFANDGIYLCGLAHSPKLVEESIAQACAAASRAATILAKDKVELDAIVSMVLDNKCDGCAYCVDPCTNHALTLIEYVRDGAIKKTIDRDLALCKGCGVCQATCPKDAIAINNFKLEQLIAMVNAALEPPAA